MHYYIKGIHTIFKGGTLDIKDKYSFDFPPIKSQSDWEAFLTNFWKDAEEFASLIQQMPEESLKEVFTDIKYGTYLRNIDAMMEHSYYHLGFRSATVLPYHSNNSSWASSLISSTLS